VIRRALLGLLCALTWRNPAFGAEFSEAKLLDFNDAYVKFFRKLYGCPPDAVNVAQCRPQQLGEFDLKLWDRARRRAEVFD
jgi:hypothetical protein